MTIPSGVTIIDDYAFYRCDKLTSVTIPNSVNSIGPHAFGECTGLTSVTIPNSVTSVGSFAFSSCTGLTSVTIGASVTSVGSYAFSSCTGLTSVTIPNSVTSVGSDAFSSCTGLTSVKIGASVISVGSYDAGGPSTPLAVTGQVVAFSRSYADWALATLGDGDADSDADSDGDGSSNGLEFTASTNPSDPDSRLQTISAVLSAEGYKLRWFAAYGVNYRVRWSRDLKDWNDLTSAYTGTGAETEAIDPTPPPEGRFYRVEIVQP